MTRKFNPKIDYAYMAPALIISFLLVSYAANTADRLSGKYFPPDSPIFSNSYPNDFLPWGLMLSLWFGWISINFICKRYSGNMRLIVISSLIAAVIVGFSTINITSKLDAIWLQSDLRAVWASYLSTLIDSWSQAWFIGGASAFGINVILPNRVIQ